MQKWEYLIITTEGRRIVNIGEETIEKSGYSNTDTEQGFVEGLGDDGWELVAIIGTSAADRNKLYFKRPKKKS